MSERIPLDEAAASFETAENYVDEMIAWELRLIEELRLANVERAKETREAREARLQSHRYAAEAANWEARCHDATGQLRTAVFASGLIGIALGTITGLLIRG